MIIAIKKNYVTNDNHICVNERQNGKVESNKYYIEKYNQKSIFHSVDDQYFQKLQGGIIKIWYDFAT